MRIVRVISHKINAIFYYRAIPKTLFKDLLNGTRSVNLYANI